MNRTDSCQGLFGYLYLNDASGKIEIKDFTLTGEVVLPDDIESQAYVGGVAGYSYIQKGSASISEVYTDIDYTGSSTAMNTLYFGGITGYEYVSSATYTMTISDCVTGGSYAADNAYATTTDSLYVIQNGYVGGIAGKMKYAYIENCISGMDITTYAKWTGGITGFADSGCGIYDCINTGKITAMAQSGAAVVGGLAGQSYGYVNNCINYGSVYAPPVNKSSNTSRANLIKVGGLVGYQYGYQISNCSNHGDVLITENDAVSYYMAGGLTGSIDRASLYNCVNYGRTIYKSYDEDENDNIGLLSGWLGYDSRSYATGSAYLSQLYIENCFTVTDKSSAAPLYNVPDNGEEANISSVGTFKSGGAVAAADGLSLMYDTTDLGMLLNKYAVDNAGGTCEYRLWIASSDGYMPYGQTVNKAAAPAVTVSADITSAATGSDVVLTAELSAADFAAGRSSISYQWYSSESSDGSDPVALTGEGASGTLSQPSGTVTYTLTQDSYSDLYYFVKAVNQLTYTDEDGNELGRSENSAAGAAVEVTFKAADSDKFQGETAEAFAGGTGTAEDPYIIATAAQLRLMAVNAATDAAYRAAHYRLANDIDYNNIKWSPVCQNASAPFTGTLDGAGYAIGNLKINASGVYAGLFAYTKNATIKDLTLRGSMKAANAKYAGGFVGYAESSWLESLTNEMTISNSNVQRTGGITGCITVPNAASGAGISGVRVMNCVNKGDITTKHDLSHTDVYGTGSILNNYTAGIIAFGLKSQAGTCFPRIFNNVNYGNISSELVNANSETARAYIAGIFVTTQSNYSLINCLNYGTITSEGAYNAAFKEQIGYSTGALQKNSCYSIPDATMSAAEVMAALNEFAADESATYPGIRLWTNESGTDNFYPDGAVAEAPGTPEITISAKTGDGEYASAGSSVTSENGAEITLKADISLAAANSVGTDSLTYQWYKASSATAAGTAVADKSGSITGLTGSSELKLSSAEYANDYYYIVVTDTVTYPGAVKAAKDTKSSAVNVVFKVNDGKFHGDAAASISGSGTEAEPYLISTPAELAFVSEKINAGAEGYAEADKYYKLTADIDYANVVLSPIGSDANTPFQGHFDGNGKTVSNVVISADGLCSGLFGYLKAADVKELTVKGTLSAEDSSQYIGGIAGYAAAGTVIKNCSSDVDISFAKTSANENISYAGGIAGYITGSGAEVNGGSSSGDIYLGLNGNTKQLYAGGVAGGVYAGAVLLNSYNTGDFSFERNADTSGIISVYAGGVAAIVSGSGSSIRNCANTGDMTARSNTEKVFCWHISEYFGGIAGYIATAGTYAENCVSYGTFTEADGTSANYYSGISSIKNQVVLEVNYCYAYGTAGSAMVFNQAGSDSYWGGNPTYKGNGYIDAENGNIKNIKPGYGKVSSEAASDYVRTDAIRSATASSGYTDVYYALNGWAGDTNTSDALKYNSWQPAGDDSSVYLPTGAAAVSPFKASGDSTALAVTLNSSDFEESFAKGATIPAVTATLSGAGSSDTATKILTTWYTSLAADGSDKTVLENTSADSLKYQPTALEGRHCYMVDVVALNGAYYASVSSSPVKVLVASDSWTGEPGDIEDLDGFGTADEPYIIDSPYMLALISELYNADASAKPAREIDEEEGNEDKAVAYKDAYYCVTTDIDMGGAYALRPIGETEFAGHFYGKKSDGSMPSIKNLYINGGNGTSSSKGGAALFSKVGAAGVIENLNFDNVKIVADLSKDQYAAAVAGLSKGTLRNITVSGLITTGGDLSGTAYLGGIAGEVWVNVAEKDALIENCVNNARIDAYASSLDAGGLVPVSSGIIAGGIAGWTYASAKNSTIAVRSCINNGSVSSYENSDNGGAGGIIGKVTAFRSSSALADTSSCINNGKITGRYKAGGIIGDIDYGITKDCYNTGSVTCTSTPTKDEYLITIGGIYGRKSDYKGTVSGCYNVGNIAQLVSEDGAYKSRSGGLIGQWTYGGEITDSYALEQDGLKTIGRDGSNTLNPLTDTSEIMSASELKSAAAAVALGDAYYYKTDSYPVLEFETAEADRCVISIKADSEDAGTAYMHAGSAKITSLQAVKDSTLSFEAAGDLGYEVTALKNGETTLTPADGVYTLNVDGSAELTATLGRASAYAVIITDYDGAAEGQVLVLYRNTALADGQAVTLDGKAMYHASAFDTAQFDEDTTNAGYASVKSEKAEAAVATYAAFAEAGTSIGDIMKLIKVKTAAQQTVDYSDYDLDSNGTVDIFDAQLIWDVMNGSTTVSASDLQRLQADFNKDGSLTVQDVLAVHKAILKQIAG